MNALSPKIAEALVRSTALSPISPDAELIALCGRFDAIEKAHHAEFMAAANDTVEGDRIMSDMAEAHEPLLERITDLPPRTLEGAVALACSIEQWSHGDFARNEDTDSWLARTLLQGLTAIVRGPVSSADEDVELIALCVAAEAAAEQSDAIWDAAEDASISSQELTKAYDEADLVFDGCRTGIAQATAIVATSVAGLQAKASLALRQLEQSGDDLPLVASVLKQIAGKSCS